MNKIIYILTIIYKILACSTAMCANNERSDCSVYEAIEEYLVNRSGNIYKKEEISFFYKTESFNNSLAKYLPEDDIFLSINSAFIEANKTKKRLSSICTKYINRSVSYRFNPRHKNIKVILSFSSIGYSLSINRSVVFVIESAKNICTQGLLFMLEKNKTGVWQVSKCIKLFVS